MIWKRNLILEWFILTVIEKYGRNGHLNWGRPSCPIVSGHYINIPIASFCTNAASWASILNCIPSLRLHQDLFSTILRIFQVLIKKEGSRCLCKIRLCLFLWCLLGIGTALTFTFVSMTHTINATWTVTRKERTNGTQY